jgi:dihydrofolate reductase
LPNIVYIATSLDGYIADKDGGVDWLQCVPNPDGDDFGFAEFIKAIDAIVMGRTTFESVLAFGIEWPYCKPVFVLSSTMSAVPVNLQDRVSAINGSVTEIVRTLHQKELTNLYIDGGKTVQSFLQADMIDELIVARIPLLLGGGVPLFGPLDEPLRLEHVSTKVHIDAIVKTHYRRKR